MKPQKMGHLHLLLAREVLTVGVELKVEGRMADAERVTARQRAILTAIIESYIETGEPVGSGTIARLQTAEGAGFSSATVRNEMAELADEGLLEQPHTSAGRVPTARAFRMYVEQLSGGAHPRIDAARLSARSRSQIDLSFQGVAGTQAVLERTSHVLATLSSGVGVAIAAAAEWGSVGACAFFTAGCCEGVGGGCDSERAGEGSCARA